MMCSFVTPSYSTPECDIDRLLGTVDIILREDLESLRRTYSESRRIDFWNRITSEYEGFMQNCSVRMPREITDIIKRNYKFAMLMLAASFKLNGEKHDEIISMFKPEEYELLLDFEEFKIFDYLDVDKIVEAIKRHDERVYGFIKRYYEKQYHTLEIRWGPLMGDLLKAFEERYSRRRKKIEEAVVAYVRKYGLIETVSEIEEVIRKILEAGEFKKNLEEELRRKIQYEYNVDQLKRSMTLLEEEREKLLEILERIENSIATTSAEVRTLTSELERTKAEKERILKTYEETSSKLSIVEKELENTRKKLEEKEKELKNLMEKYNTYVGAAEALRAEAESLRNVVSKLNSEAEEYRRMLNAISEEKKLLEERFKEVEAALRGESEERLVTSEEASAIGESYIARIKYRMTRPGTGVTVYDPRYERKVTISKWDDEKDITISRTNSPVKNRVLILAKKRGILSKTPDIILEVMVKVHEENYSLKGYDLKPVTLAEVVEIVREKSKEAEEHNHYEILAIASPTGFTRKAIEYVSGEEPHRTFISRNITLYLVDLALGEVYMNKSDPAAVSNADVVKPELPEDDVRKVVNYVLSEGTIIKAITASPAAPLILTSSIAEDIGVNDEAIILQALTKLEREGWGKKIYVEDRRVAAFRYSDRALRHIRGV